MSEHTRFSHPIYGLPPTQIEGFDSLAELALDLRWSWNHATSKLWSQLESELWEIKHNTGVVVQTVAVDGIERMLADPAFRKDVDGLVRTRRQVLEAPGWFQQSHSQGALTCTAYFSMEVM
jgi:starch phosphorylase